MLDRPSQLIVALARKQQLRRIETGLVKKVLHGSLFSHRGSVAMFSRQRLLFFNLGVQETYLVARDSKYPKPTH